LKICFFQHNLNEINSSRDYKYEIAIVNVVNQTIIDTLFLNKSLSKVEAADFKNGYLVLLDSSDECVHIYNVKPKVCTTLVLHHHSSHNLR
jgi:hypothetical protein